MKIAILGYGLEGRAAYDYWRDGNEITICDQNEQLELPDGVGSQLGDGYLSGLDAFDLIVRSPFVHPRQIAEANSLDVMMKVTSNTNEFMRVCPTKNIIGVTGTKGKGTTSTLITRILESAGKTVHLGGNIGVPALDLLKTGISANDWVVLELSSFQLIDLRTSPHIGVCLMVVSEHLDWHVDLGEYLAAKKQLFINQDEADIAVFYPANENSVTIADASLGTRIPYFEAPGALVVDGSIRIGDEVICTTDELKLLGKHNWQNVCAAVTAAWQITQDTESIRSAVTSFGGLPYRLEFVRELDGVRYYNDSFGTTPETAIVAMQAFDVPKVIILGGSDKGAEYDELAMAVMANNVRNVVLIGDQADRIQASLDRVGFEQYSPGGDTMEDIVHAAMSAAEAGDVVLLSTGCASFGLFKNYKDRGAQFNNAVNQLT